MSQVCTELTYTLPAIIVLEELDFQHFSAIISHPSGHLGQKEAGHAPLQRMLAHPQDRGEADGIFHP